MILEKNLQTIGLSEKEVKIYLALLQLGSGTVLEIAKKSEVKRPTAYLVLDQLRSLGLVSIVPKGKKSLYFAEEPKNLRNIINSKNTAFDEISPLLEAISGVNKEKPQVRLFEGVEAITENVYRQTWATYGNEQETLFFSCLRDLMVSFPQVLDSYEKSIKSGKTKLAREIISDTPEDIARAWKYRGKFPEHQIRVAPKDKVFVNTYSLIFKDKVAIVSVQKNIFAVVIQSQDIANSYRQLFELAWTSCRPIEQVINS